MPFQIAIDGPVAAGKGSVARKVAEALGFLYIDTGAMYRMTGLLAMQHSADLNDEQAVVSLLEKSTTDLRSPSGAEKDGRLITAILDGKDVSWEIRTPEASAASSKVATYPKVREILVERQQAMGATQDVVMEGRDITYRVLPNAQLKIYLTASPEARAKRRFLELSQKAGNTLTYEEILQSMIARDHQDMNRATDPLQKVEDAWEVDTSDLTIDQVVELIVNKAKELQRNT